MNDDDDNLQEALDSIDDILTDYNEIKSKSNFRFRHKKEIIASEDDGDDVDMVEDLRIHVKKTTNIRKIIHLLQDKNEDECQEEPEEEEEDECQEEQQEEEGEEEEQHEHNEDECQEEEQSEEEAPNNNKICNKKKHIKPQKNHNKRYKKKKHKHKHNNNNNNSNKNKKINVIVISDDDSCKSVIKINANNNFIKELPYSKRRVKLPYSLHHARKKQNSKRYRHWKGTERQISLEEFRRGAKSIEFNTSAIASFKTVMSKAELLKYGVLGISVVVDCLAIAVNIFNSKLPNVINKKKLIQCTKEEMIKQNLANELILTKDLPIEMFVEWGIDNLYIHPGKEKWIDAGDAIIARIEYIANERGWTFEETYIRVATEWNH